MRSDTNLIARWELTNGHPDRLVLARLNGNIVDNKGGSFAWFGHEFRGSQFETCKLFSFLCQSRKKKPTNSKYEISIIIREFIAAVPISEV